MSDYYEFIVAAKRSDDEYKERLEKQRQADTRIVFGSQTGAVGAYEPSSAVQKQLDQLAEIQKIATDAVLKCSVQF